jgi:hypothetical protein
VIDRSGLLRGERRGRPLLVVGGPRFDPTMAADLGVDKVFGRGVTDMKSFSATGLAFASCGDGTITVAHEDTPDKYTVVQTIATQRGARTMAIDTKNHNVYTVTADLGPPGPATPEIPRPRPTIIPNTFVLLIYSR